MYLIGSCIFSSIPLCIWVDVWMFILNRVLHIYSSLYLSWFMEVYASSFGTSYVKSWMCFTGCLPCRSWFIWIFLTISWPSFKTRLPTWGTHITKYQQLNSLSFNVRVTEIALLWRLILGEFSFPETCVSWTWRVTSCRPCRVEPCFWTCSTSMSRTTSCTRSFGRSTHRTSHRYSMVSDLALPYIWALKKHWTNLFLYFLSFALLCSPEFSPLYCVHLWQLFAVNKCSDLNCHQDT